MKQITWMIFGWLLLASAQAVSFDCGKASTKVEKIICGDAGLLKLDADLTKAYQQALKQSDDKQMTSKEQRQWLKEVRNACRVANCLKAAYRNRIQELVVNWGDVEATSPFKLVKGKGVEVCEIYKKNLYALGHPDLSCERKVSSEYEGIIKLPEWRKLDLWENRNLMAQVEKMSVGGINTPGHMESKDETWDNQYEIDKLARQYQETGIGKMSVVEMDINNDGKNEVILRDQSGLCGEPVHYKAIALFVLTEKGDAVDLQKSRLLFQDAWHNPWTKKFEQSGTFLNGSMYDVFFYKSITYFDKWSRSGIRVYKNSGDKTEEICHLN